MTHPEELLAGFVDGSLAPQERAAVETHLATCARCSGEVALAERARSALGSLTEVPAPSDVAARALQEAGAARAPRRSGQPPRWYRFAGVAAAAAAALVVATLVLPRIGGGSSPTSEGKRTSNEAPSANTAINAALAAVPLEIQTTNYDNASLGALAASFAPASGAGAASTPSPAKAPLAGSPQLNQKALACITKSAPKEQGQLAKLIQAKFEGTPAFIAAFLEGPGANQPPDSVTVWVFSTKSCAIVSSSFARL